MKTYLMTETAKGANECAQGISMPVQTFVKGKTYELCDSLAKCFIELGVAKLAPEEAGPGKDEHAKPTKEKKAKKDQGGAPENKAE